MTDYILIEKIWQDVFCYQVKITCASSHVVATDVATGIGVADDFLFGPLGTGVGEGLILIFE